MIKLVKKVWMWILAAVGVVIAIATLGSAVKSKKVKKIKKDIKQNQKDIEKNQAEQSKLQERRKTVSTAIKENDKDAAKSLKGRLNRNK